MKYTILAPAKVNLYLDVLSKRADGYHDLRSVMQAISLYDDISLEIIPSSNTEINIDGSSNEIKWDESNLAYKACSLFLNEANIDGYKLSLYIDKHIPVCAGMAGGSTDAAGTLLLLNKAFNFPFSTEKLCTLGARLGADIAFCIIGGTCLCEGIGERVTPISSFGGKYMVCAIDSSSVSTPKAYALLDEKYGTACGDSSDLNSFLTSVENNDLSKACSLFYNKFESVIIPEIPKIQQIKDILLENGALGALMSGSGPSVFGVFSTEKEQNNAYKALCDAKIQAFLCKSL